MALALHPALTFDYLIFLDPLKQDHRAEIFEEDESVRRVEFLPQRVGDHEIHISVNSIDVNGSPFICKMSELLGSTKLACLGRVYDPTKIMVGRIPDGAVNSPVHFTGNICLYTLSLLIHV